jgi:ABC-type multidrug transport system permease subunit
MVCFRYVIVNTLRKGDNEDGIITIIIIIIMIIIIAFISFYLSTAVCDRREGSPSLLSTYNIYSYKPFVFNCE